MAKIYLELNYLYVIVFCLIFEIIYSHLYVFFDIVDKILVCLLLRTKQPTFTSFIFTTRPQDV